MFVRSFEPGESDEDEGSHDESRQQLQQQQKQPLFGGAAGDLATDFNFAVATPSESLSPSVHTPRSVTSGRSSLTSGARTFTAISNYFSRYLRRRPAVAEEETEQLDEKAKAEQKARNASEAAFHQMFEGVDQNQDGRVDVTELKRLMDGIGLTAKRRELVRLFKRIDRDGDGVITFDDFRLDWIERWQNAKDREALVIGLFKLLDLSSDGIIEQKEIKMVMMSIGEKVTNQEIDEMFKQFDKNGSGAIDPDEFTKAMMTHITKMMPEEADIERIKTEAQQRTARIKALALGRSGQQEQVAPKLAPNKQQQPNPPAYYSPSDDEAASAIRITTV